MTSLAPLLFQPFALRGLTLRNRVVVSPMVTYGARHGFVGDWHLMHLGRFAVGGAGLVMMESTKVDPRGCSTIRDAGLWDDAFIPGLKRVADFVKSFGAAVGIQLSHTGRKARTSLPWEGRGPLSREAAGPVDWDWELVGPSAVAHDGSYEAPRALSEAEVAAMARAWGEAARRADEAGFDVVEIHAAHGYLIHQFLSAHANKRTDRYGGSRENRFRFALEVAEQVRRNWPDHKPLFMRVSAVDEAGWTLADSAALAAALRGKGVDLIDCSAGGIGNGMNLGTQHELRYGYQVAYADAIRRDAGIPTLAVGLIIHADQAEAILRNGEADLIGIGREMLHNPNWAIDAAQKLGHAAIFDTLPPAFGFWLKKRAESGFGGCPSTWQKGLTA